MYGNRIFYSAHFSRVTEKLGFQVQGVREKMPPSKKSDLKIIETTHGMMIVPY